MARGLRAASVRFRVAAIVRITGGNFRLLRRLFVQIANVLRINEVTHVTDDVDDAARSTLVIGAN